VGLNVFENVFENVVENVRENDGKTQAAKMSRREHTRMTPWGVSGLGTVATAKLLIDSFRRNAVCRALEVASRTFTELMVPPL
jgi:hypothetical protein